MSTLPFLLSVADELDNINSQSYMDDFGLGFHPHRQYYRTPTIQLSLPASTDWMQQERSQQRYRSHKFYDETQNNFQTTAEEDCGDGDFDGYSGGGGGGVGVGVGGADNGQDKSSRNAYESAMDCYATKNNEPSTSSAAAAVGAGPGAGAGGKGKGKGAGVVGGRGQKLVSSALNSNRIDAITAASRGGTTGSGIVTIKSGNRSCNITAMREHAHNADDGDDDHDDDDDDDDNIDNSVRMYNLSKKCCKNYHRHAIETNVRNGSGSRSGGGGAGGSVATSGGNSGGTAAAAGVGSYRLHSKCMEGNNSSSEESLQKVSSSIEFLTCFLLKRSRAPSSSSSSRNATGSSGTGGNSKKS